MPSSSTMWKALLPLAAYYSYIATGQGGGGSGGALAHADHSHHEHRCGAEELRNILVARDQARLQRALHTADHNNHNNDERNLGPTTDRRQQQQQQQRYLQRLSCDELCDGCITIDTYFHFMVFEFDGGMRIPHPTSAMQRYDAGDSTLRGSDFTSVDGMRQILRNQIDFANQAMAGTPFRFNFIEDEITQTNNNSYMRFPLESNRQMSATIGNQDLRKLDVYLSYTIAFESEAGNIPLRLGNAYFPSQQLEGTSDGMYMRYDTLRGGGLGSGSLDGGITFLHEFGHWLGLYHTFRVSDVSEFGCEAFPNDFIDDTPAHQGDSINVDCNIIIPPFNQPAPDTCPALPGLDPVLNYMNYVRTDVCLVNSGEFTCNQIERMYWQWTLYREEVDVCPPGEMEIEFALEFDNAHLEDNAFFLYKNRGTPEEEIIFDSNIDHDPGAFQLQDIVAVDLCVPQDVDYEFEVTDRSGNGFSSGGEVVVFQNTQLLAGTTGNFGSVYTVSIPAVGPAETPAPTSSPTTLEPTAFPATEAPTASPVQDIVIDTGVPTLSPTSSPLISPTLSPIRSPTDPPTMEPTREMPMEPDEEPTPAPSPFPTPIDDVESALPTTLRPTGVPRTQKPTPERMIVPMKPKKSSNGMSKLHSSKSYLRSMSSSSSSSSKGMMSSMSKKSKMDKKSMSSMDKSMYKLSRSGKGKGSSSSPNKGGTLATPHPTPLRTSPLPTSVLVGRPAAADDIDDDDYYDDTPTPVPTSADSALSPAEVGQGGGFQLWSKKNNDNNNNVFNT